MDSKRKNLIAILGILSITLIIVGVSYSFFSYTKEGTTENIIKSGNITFHYTEGNRGISINNALPMDDAEGMIQTDYFDFTIESTTKQTVEIPYYITVRRSTDSEVALDSHVKVYLTKVDGNNNETPLTLITNQNTSKFSELDAYTNPHITIPDSEKALYTDTVPVNSTNYQEKYRLRMWVDKDTDFGVVTKYYCGTTEITEAQYNSNEYTCVSGEKTIQNIYPYNDKKYTLTVNVYSEGKVVQSTSNGGTIESCPGCRYIFSTSNYLYKPGYASTLNKEDTKENYTDVVAESGKPYFLGVVLSDGDHGTIERVFGCAVDNQTPFCMEGVLGAAVGGDETICAETYAASNTLLNSVYGPYDSSTYLGCRNRTSEIECRGSLYISVSEYGSVQISGDNGSCNISNGGFARCSVW